MSILLFTLQGSEMIINTYAVEVTPQDGHWEYSLQHTFESPETTPDYFLVSPASWSRDRKNTSIIGYSGRIELKFKTPGPATALQGVYTIRNGANYTAGVVYAEYSLDEVQYHRFASQDLQGKEQEIRFDLSIPDSPRIVRIAFGIESSERDARGRMKRLPAALVSDSLQLTIKGIHDPSWQPSLLPGRPLKSYFVTSVSFPWERIGSCAQYAGIDKWEFLERTLKILKTNHIYHVSTLNLSNPADGRRFLFIAEKVGMKVLPQSLLWQAFYTKPESLREFERLARITVNEYGDFSSLEGYVLKDEPLAVSLAQINYCFDLMKRIDPSRDTISCTMNRQTQLYIENSAFPVIMNDLYYFGSDKSTQLSNPQATSMQNLTWALRTFNHSAEQHQKHYWFIMQYFGDVWGRHYYQNDADYRAGRLTVEPGSYLHWRTPTDAELRWQIWEGVRLGAKGIRLYISLPEIPLLQAPAQIDLESGTPSAKRVASMDRMQKIAASWKNQPLVEKEFILERHRSGLLFADGTPVPEIQVVSKAFQALLEQQAILLQKRQAAFPVFYAGDPLTSTGTFEVTGNPNRIGVIVNRDLNHPARQVEVLLPVNVNRLTRLNTGETLPLTRKNEDFLMAVVTLDPGDGLLLEASFRDDIAGMPFCAERFSQTSLNILAMGEHAEILTHTRPDSESLRLVKLKEAAPFDHPVLTAKNFANAQKIRNTFSLNFNLNKAEGRTYCLLEGEFSAGDVVVKALSDKDRAVVENNVMHLENPAEQDAGKRPVAGQVIQEKDYHVPAIIPVGTTDIEFYLTSHKAHISAVDIWFVPKKE